MSTRIDIPADPVRADEPRSPPAAEIPDDACTAEAVVSKMLPEWFGSSWL